MGKSVKSNTPGSTSTISTVALTYAAIFALVLSVGALSVAGYMWLSKPDLAYIDSSRLMQTYDGAIAARQTLSERQEAWRSNIQVLQAEVGALSQSIMQANLSPSALKAKRDSLSAKQEELARYQHAVSKKAEALQVELMQPVYDNLNAEIQRFGKAKGYDLIFGTVSGGNILYAEEASDVTDVFLEYVGNTYAQAEAPEKGDSNGKSDTQKSRSEKKEDIDAGPSAEEAGSSAEKDNAAPASQVKPVKGASSE